MINANDLRIGNICLRKNKHTNIEEIHILTASCILDISSNGVISSFIYEPIPLTEEILLKCGFKRLSINKFYLGSYIIHFEGSLIMCVKSGVLLTTLHQLQNLYFALTNEELKINL